MQRDAAYGARLAILYGTLWFIDLLDASFLNVALPQISNALGTDPTQAEWALVGFLLPMSIGMLLSIKLGEFFGTRKVFLGAQVLYIISSIACGFSENIAQLVIFRIFQGFGGGLSVPIGMMLMMSVMPQEKWAKTASTMNLFTLLAPAIGPVLSGYITAQLGWPWLFFLKLPLSFALLYLSYRWVRRVPRKAAQTFDWLGLYFSAFGLSAILLVLSEVGKPLIGKELLIIIFVLGLAFLAAFIWQERRAAHPLIPLEIFHSHFFSLGNIIQSAANIVFLGATFLIALFLQRSLGYSVTQTGWVLAAITVGMLAMLPIIGKHYNKVGPLPFMIPGLLLMAASMFAFLWVTPALSPWIVALIIFVEGMGSTLVQTPNVMMIFCELPQAQKGTGSALYALFKQVSASIGIALTIMLLSLQMKFEGIRTLPSEASPELFRNAFILLGIIPLLAFVLCLFVDNRRALKKLHSVDHLKTETEYGTE